MTQINSINTEEKNPDEDKDSDLMPSYGETNRYLYKENVDRAKSTALDQAIGVKEQYAPSNPNDYIYGRTVEFPQPTIAGIGVVLSTGAVDTTRFFYSQRWLPSRSSAGVYLITHNIGDAKYSVQVSPVALTAFTANISVYSANSVEIRTFNAAGTATDCSFTFTVWIIP